MFLYCSYMQIRSLALPSAEFRDAIQLAPARMHEAGGTGRHAFAIWQAIRHPGPVFWVQPAHDHSLPFPRGLPTGLCNRLYMLRPQSEVDLLWTVEQALRAGPVGLVIAAPEKPLSLTAGRRLQLAAEEGQTVALMLIAENAGSNATETRWHCRPLPSGGEAGWHEWHLVKNKRGRTACWRLAWDGISDQVTELAGMPMPQPEFRHRRSDGGAHVVDADPVAAVLALLQNDLSSKAECRCEDL